MTQPVVCIVAEYNPLHNGHAWHIAQSRATSGARAVMVVLSSHFVQRGEPAFLDKWTRTRLALEAGADLVLELPTYFSCSNAGVFGNAAVDIAAATGVVTDMAFGMETPECDLERTVDILVHEPPQFKEALRTNLEAGYSYVEARSRALGSLCPEGEELLRRPNNSLAVAYCMRITARHLGIRPRAIQRRGGGYHSEAPHPMAGASAVRRMVRQGEETDAEKALPAFTWRAVREALEAGRIPLDSDLLWRCVRTVLLRNTPRETAASSEMAEGLEHRLHRAALACTSWEEAVDFCTSRRYPRGRIQRHFIHLLLGITHSFGRRLQRTGPPYIRILGATGRGRTVLKEIKSRAALPILSKAAAPRGTPAYEVVALEHRAAALWENLVPAPQARTEARRSTVVTD
ncbi:MAG: nucleotidyltransferase family protein [Synergistales bacterium]|nr:nucleotidyltransferase family protein [Synergistales bacterium]